jgi:hypothetical protein
VSTPNPAVKAVDTALLLALATALSYAVSMSFECGYASFFGVPAKLVEASPKNTIICAVTVLFGIPGGVWMWDTLGTMWPRKWHWAIRRAVFSILAIPISALVMYFFLGISLLALMILMLPFFLYFVLTELAFPLLAHRSKATFVEKLEAEQEKSANELAKSPTFSLSFIKRFGVLPLTYVVLFLASCAVAFGFGFRDARTEDRFLVSIAKDDSCVFVTNYLDTLICAEFDSVKHSLTGGIRFIPLHEPSSKFELQMLGRLSPAESNSWAPVRPKEVPKKATEAVAPPPLTAPAEKTTSPTSTPPSK